MRLRINHLLFLSYAVLIALIALMLSGWATSSLRDRLVEGMRRDLGREVALTSAILEASGIEPDSLARVVGVLTSRNLVVVDSAGATVTHGTAPVPAAGDFRSRPEIREALELPSGESFTVRNAQGTGEERLFVAKRTDSGYVLRLDAPLDGVQAAVSTLRRRIFGAAGAALLLGVLFTAAFGRRFSRPLRGMGEVARALAAGDLDRRTRLHRDDELGDLSTSLDRLADELQRRLGQLEGERAEMHALIDSMSEGVLVFASSGMLRRSNPAARRMFMLDTAAEGIPPEMVSRRDDFLDLVTQAMGGATVPPREIGGDGRPLLATAHALPQGGAMAVFLDVSELRRLEGVRRDFVANASHELKTPLTAIRGFSETLLDPDLPPELAKRFAEIVRQNAERLQHIVDDLLDLSRIESGEQHLEQSSVDVAVLAQQIWEELLGVAVDGPVELRLDLAPGHTHVLADPDALRHILTNLFSNAVRHTPDGGSVTVRTLATPQPAGHAERASTSSPASGWTSVEVVDTGTGISGTHLPRIFERFYRADPARSREEGGTGLGLSIVRHLVESHGGNIEAISEVGTGTTIRFTLPTPG